MPDHRNRKISSELETHWKRRDIPFGPSHLPAVSCESCKANLSTLTSCADDLGIRLRYNDVIQSSQDFLKLEPLIRVLLSVNQSLSMSSESHTTSDINVNFVPAPPSPNPIIRQHINVRDVFNQISSCPDGASTPDSVMNSALVFMPDCLKIDKIARIRVLILEDVQTIACVFFIDYNSDMIHNLPPRVPSIRHEHPDTYSINRRNNQSLPINHYPIQIARTRVTLRKA